jgi:hypothetical protein
MQVEAGSTPGASDIGVFRTADPFGNIQFQGVPLGTYYVRIRGVRNGVVEAASNEVVLAVLCEAPPPVIDAQATVVGNAARFTWSYARSSLADFTVRLEAGSSPGAANLASIAMPRAANTGFNATGVAGTYFTRLRAVNACGSTVSEEIPVTLASACPAPGQIPFVNTNLFNSGELSVEWQRPASGGLESSYRVEVGSEPGQSDLAQRVVDGRSMPARGFQEWFSGISASHAHVRVTPLNTCGAGPTSFEARARRGCFTAPPSELRATVAGRRVELLWGPAQPESGSYFDDFVEIGTSVFASNVLTADVSIRPGYPGEFTAELAPGRYFARVRRFASHCGERSNPSPEVTFVIAP